MKNLLYLKDQFKMVNVLQVNLIKNPISKYAISMRKLSENYSLEL